MVAFVLVVAGFAALPATVTGAVAAETPATRIVSPVDGEVVEGDFTVTVVSDAATVTIGVTSRADPQRGWGPGQTVPVVDGVAQVTMSSRGLADGAELYACPGTSIDCWGGDRTEELVTLSVPNDPVTLGSLRDGDVVRGDAVLDLGDPYPGLSRMVRAGELVPQPNGTTSWRIRGQLGPTTEDTVRFADLTHIGRSLGGGDFEVYATGCEPTPELCLGRGTRAKIAIDAPLTLGLYGGIYEPAANRWELVMQRSIASDATITLHRADGTLVRPPIDLGYRAMFDDAIRLEAVDATGNPLPEGRYYVWVDLTRESTHAATPLTFTGRAGVWITVDRHAPQVLSSSLSRSTLTTVPDRPADPLSIDLRTDEPTRVYLTITNAAGTPVYQRIEIPPGEEKHFTEDWHGWGNPDSPFAEHPYLQQLPEGTYTITATVEDYYGNTATHTLGNITLRHGHWTHTTRRITVTPRQSVTATRVAGCATLRQPATRSWPGSYRYLNRPRCNGVTTTHQIRLPRTPYRLLSARVDIVGGATPTAPKTTAQARTTRPLALPWTPLAAPLRTHTISRLSTAQLTDATHLSWQAALRRPGAYDIRRFLITVRYETGITPNP